jgi:hypothetical protein
MSCQFIAASSQKLVLTPILSGVAPFTFGCWVYSINNSGQIWQLGTTGAPAFYIASSFPVTFSYWTGSANAGLMNAMSDVNEWMYLIWRVINNSLRRASMVKSDGTILHDSNTSTITPAGGFTHMALGASTGTGAYLEGKLAEFFYADADIQPDGGVLNNDLLRQIAYRGIFSVPHLVPSVVEYRSLRYGPFIGGPDEIYQRSGARPWVASGSPPSWQHPPFLRGDYVRPNQSVLRPAMI